MEVLSDILRGGADAATEAGAPVLGGHSIDDPEPKYGMAVTGVVHPGRILRNVGAKPGDQILLTKPLGSGIAATAIKRGIASEDLTARATRLMATLNKAAGEVLAASGAVSALTDVTGFGLLGHAWEMAEGSRVTIRIDSSRVPLLDGIRDLADRDVLPGGSKANLDWVRPNVRFGQKVGPTTQLILADAQTNGGLLAAVKPERLSALLALLADAGVAAAHIGEVAPTSGPPGLEVA
jgi:selenide, water dikinase